MCLAHNTFFATPEIMNTAGTYATTICTLPLNTASCNTLCFTFAKHNHSSKSMYEQHFTKSPSTCSWPTFVSPKSNLAIHSHLTLLDF